MKNPTFVALGAAMILGSAFGCSTQGNVDIGGSTGSSLSDYVASWDGYAEAYQFDSGSDRLRITIGSDGSGTLEVADQPAIPPATDPNVGYPPGRAFAGLDDGGHATLLAGFQYPIHMASVESSRIRFGVDPKELYQPWCQMQTPFSWPSNPAEQSYECIPNSVSASDPSNPPCSLTDPAGTVTTIDCGKLTLCGFFFICSCTATSCSTGPVPTDYPIQIDASLEMSGGQMVGTLVLKDQTGSKTDQRITVRLTRQ